MNTDIFFQTLVVFLPILDLAHVFLQAAHICGLAHVFINDDVIPNQ